MPLYSLSLNLFSKFTSDPLGYCQYFTIIDSAVINTLNPYFHGFSSYFLKIIFPKWNCSIKNHTFFFQHEENCFPITKTVHIYLENLKNINNYKGERKNYQISNHPEATLISFVFW